LKLYVNIGFKLYNVYILFLIVWFSRLQFSMLWYLVTGYLLNVGIFYTASFQKGFELFFCLWKYMLKSPIIVIKSYHFAYHVLH